MEIEGERVSSNQNERTFEGGGCSKTSKGKQGGRRGILSEYTFWIPPCYYLFLVFRWRQLSLHHQNCMKQFFINAEDLSINIDEKGWEKQGQTWEINKCFLFTKQNFFPRTISTLTKNWTTKTKTTYASTWRSKTL